MDNLNIKDTQESELDRILREASSFDDPFAPSNPAENAVEEAPQPEQAPVEARPAVKAARPNRGIPVEKKILANIRANSAKKAEEKRNLQEQQAIQAQQVALGKQIPEEELAPTAVAKPSAGEAAKNMMGKAAGAAKALAAKTVQLKSTKAAPEEQAAEETEATVMEAAVETEAAAETETAVQGDVPVQEAVEQKPAKVKKTVKLPKFEKKAKAPKAPKEPKPVIKLPGILTPVLVVISIVCLLWVGVNVHPSTGTATAAATEKKLNLSEKLDISMNNAASDALSNLTYIKKLYTIPESDLVAPKPQATFGSTNDPAEVQAVVEQAAELLDGQTLAWNPNLKFWDGEPIQYYYDETILAITWKEIIDGKMCSFGEVKVAHGSQLRRALAGGQYGSSVEEYPTNMAANVNAVLAINGDFYNFRDFGITVYQRQLYRHAPKSVDTCYFTADGNMIFSKRGELADKAEAEQFIKDNNVLFSVAFGPVLIENGEKITTTQYPIGEIQKNYSRAVIAEKDDLHYLLMTINYEGPCQVTTTLQHTRDIIYSKNVRNAYTLDGGQTSSMVFNGELVNRVDWGNERTMSDIIYFASAVPNQEG